jgi:hypothetical protein
MQVASTGRTLHKAGRRQPVNPWRELRWSFRFPFDSQPFKHGMFCHMSPSSKRVSMCGTPPWAWVLRILRIRLPSDWLSEASIRYVHLCIDDPLVSPLSHVFALAPVRQSDSRATVSHPPVASPTPSW